MKPILISLLTIGAVAAVAIAGTNAFFSDEEVSESNVFEAGAIDLLLTNEASASAGVIDESETWTEFDDVNDRVMMDFTDIKPGDTGENTIGFEVTSNDAWMCAEIIVEENEENSWLQQEQDDGDATELVGELPDDLMIMWWEDDGDNLLGAEETPKFGGPRTLSEWLTITGGGTTLDLTFADSFHNWSDDASDGDPISPDTPFHLGIAWCLGDMQLTNDANPGWTCDGENVDNTPQTDSILASLSFETVQYRNNADFLCPENQL